MTTIEPLETTGSCEETDCDLFAARLRFVMLRCASATLAYAYRYVDGRSSVLRTQDGGRRWQTIRTAVDRR